MKPKNEQTLTEPCDAKCANADVIPHIAASAVCRQSPPLVEMLQPALEAEDIFQKLSRQRHCLFLDSALRENTLGRFSFIAVDPFDFLDASVGDGDPLKELRLRLTRFTAPRVEGMPPFQGGAAGLFGYDLARSLERLPGPRWNEFSMPSLAIGLYDLVVAVDHSSQETWLISQGFPEMDTPRRLQRAERRLAQLKAWLHDGSGGRSRVTSAKIVEPNELAPQFHVRDEMGMTSNFSADGYYRAVQRAINYIYAGDVFQVNLSQRLLCRADDFPVQLYLRLRRRNPATFAGFFDTGEFQIISASPERFLRVDDRRVEARPIKGTRPRTSLPEADLFAASDLRRSEKDRAENVMIVDLLRNDISRVCQPHSVQVAQLCQPEVYQYVHHLVSSVRGQLSSAATPMDLIRAAFPGGSVTGAPKVRAMQIIAELEPTARGAYCGALGYIGFDGSIDLNILIRTITAGRGWWQMPVGGGIVSQSDPKHEYAETWHKAEGLIRALR